MKTTCCIYTKQKKWNFGQTTCPDHVEDKAVKDLFEYDETVAYDPKAQYVGRIGRVDEKDPMELETLPQEYAQFKHLFQPRASEKCRQGERLIMRSTLRKEPNLLGDLFILCHNTS